MHTTDQDLHDYAQQGSPEAFRRIADRYVGAVHSAALRVLWQRQPLAEEVTQEVFVLLARKASALPSSIELGGWLHRQAVRLSLNALRTERRRAVREATALELHTMNTPTDESHRWADVMPHVDAEMLKLSAADQQALALRFFDGRELSDIASALGISAGAVQKRIARALEALRVRLQRRGVALSATALGALMSTKFVQASLAPVAATIATQALAATTTATGTALISTLLAMKMKIALAVAAVLLVSAVGYDLASANSRVQAWWSRFSPATPVATVPNERALPANAAPTAKNSEAVIAARGIWAGVERFADARSLADMKRRVMLEQDPDKRFALLQQMGVRLSRHTFDKIFQGERHPQIADSNDTFDVLRNKTDAFDRYFISWLKEDPLAALAWSFTNPTDARELKQHMVYASATQRLEPDTWREWMKGLTDPDHIKMASLVLQSLTNLPALIGQIGKGDDDYFLIGLALYRQLDHPDLAPIVQRLDGEASGYLDYTMKWAFDNGIPPQALDAAIAAISHLSNEGARTKFANLLRACRGDPGSDYPAMLTYARQCAKETDVNFDQHLLKAWAKGNPETAIRYTGKLPTPNDLDTVMGALKQLPSEDVLLSWLSESSSSYRDRALYTLYSRQDGTPMGTLGKIMASHTLTDQVETASFVIHNLPLTEAKAAAEWIATLAPGDDRRALAFELLKPLAAVDPQAALTFAQQEGHGTRESSIIPPVMQFAAKNDLSHATEFIQQVTDPDMYGKALALVAVVKFAGRPYQAIEYLKANAHGDWQPAALRMFTDHYYGNNNPATISANAAEVLRLDLQQLGTYAIERANIMGEIWAKKATMDEPLNWTLRFPADLGTGARAKLAANPALKPPMLKQFQSWLQTVAISETERGALIAMLNARLNK